MQWHPLLAAWAGLPLSRQAAQPPHDGRPQSLVLLLVAIRSDSCGSRAQPDDRLEDLNLFRFASFVFCCWVSTTSFLRSRAEALFGFLDTQEDEYLTGAVGDTFDLRSTRQLKDLEAQHSTSLSAQAALTWRFAQDDAS